MIFDDLLDGLSVGRDGRGYREVPNLRGVVNSLVTLRVPTELVNKRTKLLTIPSRA